MAEGAGKTDWGTVFTPANVARGAAGASTAAAMLAGGGWVSVWVLDATDEPVINVLGSFFIGLFFLSAAFISFMLIGEPLLNAWSETRSAVAKPERKPTKAAKTPPSRTVRMVRRLMGIAVAGMVLVIGLAVIAALLDGDGGSGKTPAIAVVLGGLFLVTARWLYRTIRGAGPPVVDTSTEPAVKPGRRKAKPARKTDLAPTDTENLEDSAIDTGPQSPQIGHTVWRTASRRNTAVLVPVAGLLFVLPLGLVMAVGAHAGEMDREAFIPGIGIAILALVLVAFYPLLRRRGREVMRLGFDWSRNLLWVERGGRLHWMPNANMIESFGLVRTDDGPLFDPGVMIMTDGAVASTRDKAWTIVAERTDDHRWLLFATECYSRREANNLVARAEALLSAQN